MEVNLPLIKIKSIERPYHRYFYHFLALHPRSPHHYGDISVLFKRPWPTLECPSNDDIGAKSVEIRAVLGEKNIFIRPFVPFHRAIFPNLFFSRVGCWTNVSYRGWKESNPIQLCEYYFFAKFYVGRRAFKKERKKRKEERERKKECTRTLARKFVLSSTRPACPWHVALWIAWKGDQRRNL